MGNIIRVRMRMSNFLIIINPSINSKAESCLLQLGLPHWLLYSFLDARYNVGICYSSILKSFTTITAL